MPKEPEKATLHSLFLSPEALVPNPPIPHQFLQEFSSVSVAQKQPLTFHFTEKKC